MNLELLPFSVSELEGRDLPETALSLIETQNLESMLRTLALTKKGMGERHQKMQKYFPQGRLPGICFLREPKIREQLLTILDCDVRLVRKIHVPYGDILRLLEALTRNAGEPISIVDLKRECGLSGPTIKKPLYVFEAVFLIHHVPIEGSTAGTSIWFEDQAECAVLAVRDFSDQEQLAQSAFSNLRQQFAYQIGTGAQYFLNFSTRTFLYVVS